MYLFIVQGFRISFLLGIKLGSFRGGVGVKQEVRVLVMEPGHIDGLVECSLQQGVSMCNALVTPEQLR